MTHSSMVDCFQNSKMVGWVEKVRLHQKLAPKLLHCTASKTENDCTKTKVAIISETALIVKTERHNQKVFILLV